MTYPELKLPPSPPVVVNPNELELPPGRINHILCVRENGGVVTRVFESLDDFNSCKMSLLFDLAEIVDEFHFTPTP